MQIISFGCWQWNWMKTKVLKLKMITKDRCCAIRWHDILRSLVYGIVTWRKFLSRFFKSRWLLRFSHKNNFLLTRNVHGKSHFKLKSKQNIFHFSLKKKRRSAFNTFLFSQRFSIVIICEWTLDNVNSKMKNVIFHLNGN